MSALNDMVPVRSRRQITYPLEKLGINAPSERVLKEKECYALNHINRKLVMEPKASGLIIYVAVRVIATQRKIKISDEKTTCNISIFFFIFSAQAVI